MSIDHATDHGAAARLAGIGPLRRVAAPGAKRAACRLHLAAGIRPAAPAAADPAARAVRARGGHQLLGGATDHRRHAIPGRYAQHVPDPGRLLAADHHSSDPARTAGCARTPAIARSESAGRRRAARVLAVPADRPRQRRHRMQASCSASCWRRSVTCAAPARTGCACAIRCCGCARTSSRNPPPLPRTSSPRAARCCSTWKRTTSPSSATAKTVLRRRGRWLELLPVPGTALGLLRRRRAQSARQRRAAGQHPAGAALWRPAGDHQGEHALDRAPSRVSRLRRRQALRCARARGRRGADSGTVDLAPPITPIRARCRGCGTSSSESSSTFRLRPTATMANACSRSCRACRAMNCSRPASRT